jgi:drug/metabolite transporter (DMT)-like permease
MRLALLTALTMCAFAANSVLNRMALKGGLIGAFDFAAIRLASGAVALAALVFLLGRGLPLRAPGRALGVMALALYMLGFSFAYLGLEAGTGALILFGGVQLTMFAGALWLGEPVAARRWIGAGLAFAGLILLLWRADGGAPPLGPALSMAAAAVGWGLYSLAGRGSGDALAGTAANFCLATPLGLVPLLFAGRAAGPTPEGIGLALLSGVVTSGLGYALWYRLLPDLGAARAAVVQLSVPVIAALGGLLILAELPDLRFVAAAAAVLGGVALATIRLPRVAR